jgi:hypothetical protein
MTDLPEFRDQDALVEWFHGVDLEALDLEDALEVTVAANVRLTLDDQWVVRTTASAGAVSVAVTDLRVLA